MSDELDRLYSRVMSSVTSLDAVFEQFEARHRTTKYDPMVFYYFNPRYFSGKRDDYVAYVRARSLGMASRIQNTELVRDLQSRDDVILSRDKDKIWIVLALVPAGKEKEFLGEMGQYIEPRIKLDTHKALITFFVFDKTEGMVSTRMLPYQENKNLTIIAYALDDDAKIRASISRLELTLQVLKG